MTEGKEEVGTLAGLEGLSSEDFVNNIMTEVESTSAPTATSKPAIEKPAAPEKVADQTPTSTEGAVTTKKEGEASVKKEEEKVATPVNDLATAQSKLDEGLKNAKTEEEKSQLQATFEAEKKAIEGKDVTPVELDFKLPEEKVAEEAEKNGWQDLAKEFGFEIKSDTLEDYKAGVDDFYKNKYEINLGKYEPETQRFIQFLEAGGTIDSFVEPLKPFAELKSLSDIDLIDRDLELRKWPADKREKELERLNESGELELQAFKIRETLGTLEEKAKQKIIDQQLSAGNRKESFKQISAAEEISNFKKSLDKMSDFMEIPMKPKIKEFLVKNLESGKYADIQIKDPAIRAQFITFLEFGKDAIDLLKKKTAENIRIEYQKDKHNVPPLVSNSAGGSAKSPTQTDVPEGGAGNWAALEGFNDHVFKEINK